MSTESKKERRKKIKKEMSLQESDGSGTAYPTTGKLKRQSTVGSTQITTSAPPPSSKTSTSSSSSSSTKIKTEPTKKSSAGTCILKNKKYIKFLTFLLTMYYI